MNKIECLDCGYAGEPDIEDDGENGIWWCPECGSLYVSILEKEMTDYEKLEWTHFAIQEAMNGNTSELDRAISFLEDVREKYI